jgi:hypothetical protein
MVGAILLPATAPLLGFLKFSRTCCPRQVAPLAGITTPSAYLVNDLPSEILHSPLLTFPLGAVTLIFMQFKASFKLARLVSC